jgi:hypothetical protein
VMRQSHFPNSRGELNTSVPSVRRSMESSLAANVSAFVDIENDSRIAVLVRWVRETKFTTPDAPSLLPHH